MDLIQMKKILGHMYVCFLTVLTCSVFFYLSSLARVVFFVLIPGFASVLLSSKMLFIIGNLIIILAIVVDSRIFSPDYSSSTTHHVCFHDEYVNSSETPWPQFLTSQFKIRSEKQREKNVAERVKEMRMEENESEQSVVSASSDELNKRADEFIARVLRQRRLELSHLKRDRFSLGYH